MRKKDQQKLKTEPALDCKAEFPIFARLPVEFVYLDNAATTHKPRSVLAELENFYINLNSNIHRGLYPLSERATVAYEAARDRLARFIGAEDRCEVIFTKGTTEAVNLVALAWGEVHIEAGDEILVTVLEHHSNFLPWQKLAQRKGAKLKVIPLNSDGAITLEELEGVISAKTKLAALTHVSNVTGVVLPLEGMVARLHRAGVKVLVDAAQSVGHRPIEVGKIGCDWLVFSGHKMYGPTGVGVLYGRRELLEEMEPCFWGGGMVEEVSEAVVRCADLPYKFEAGTPPIAEAIALAQAVEFLQTIGWDRILKQEWDLSNYAQAKLTDCSGLEIIGPDRAEDRAGVWSFTVEGIHPHDLVYLAGERGVCLRAGLHCAEPLHRCLGLGASCRISWAVYNRRSDIEALVEAIEYAKKLLQYD